MPSDWRHVIDLDELSDRKGKLVRVEERAIALFRVRDEVFATDNQCPHEGYPLTEGSIQDGVLTCNWHNWKFKLEGGTCLFGGEDVRSYPTEVREEKVYVDIQDPPLDVAVSRRKDSLRAALEDMDTSRMARDVVRLLKMDTDPGEILLHAASYGAERAEYGWNHALAVVTDCSRMIGGLDGLDRALPLTQACRAVSEENLRLPPRPHAGPVSIEKYPTLDAVFHDLRDAIEKNRLEDAESLFRGAVAARAPRRDLEKWIYTLATDHFLAYGHALIYATKAFEMWDSLGERAVSDVFPSLIPELCYATREDLLPYMRITMKSLERVLPELPGQIEKQRESKAVEFDEDTFCEVLLDAGPRDTFAATHEALDRGVPVDRILDATVLAASERLLRFNPENDRFRDKDYGWLDATHNLTYANAVRKAFRAYPSIEVLRAVYFATWFVNRTRKLDLPEESRSSGEPSLEGPISSDIIRATIADHDLEGAVAAADAMCRDAEGARSLGNLLVTFSLEDHASAQIYVDHLIKTAMTAAEESRRLADHPRGNLPLLGTIRFFAADRRERQIQRQVHLAIDFVEHGKPSETI